MTATSLPVLVYRAKDAVEARTLAAHLESAGVEAHVLGEFLQGAYAGLHVGGMDAPEIWVSSGDLPRAELVIAEWRESLRTSPHSDRMDSAASAKPFKLQFSTAALLWITTCVAIFATGAAFELVTYANWPTWIFNLFVFSLVLLAAVKGAGRMRRDANRCTDDGSRLE